jgi:D-alanyl-D-alanine carboxypeptidase
MKKSIFTLLFLFCAGSSMLYAQVPSLIAQKFQSTLDSVCNKYKIKGTSAAILIPNVGVWKGTNGVSEEGVPVTSDMLMGMGSNTKTHISALLLKMQEQHLLSLNDTIGEWIQGYPNINGQITIRQCLNHTSGLFDYLQNDAVNDSIFGDPGKIWKPEEILWLAKAPNFAPGSNWDYSNTNYIIAGIIISKVLNMSPYQALHDWILVPHQLSNTFSYGDQGTLTVAHPWSMTMNDENLVDMTTTPFLDNIFSLASTAGSLITNAEDNVQFWHKLCTKQIVNEQSWKEMTQMVSLGSGDGYGLGIFRYSRKMNGRTFYSHGGTFFGYINENMFDTTSGVTISVLTNQDSVNNDGLLALVIRSLHKVTLTMPVTGLKESVYNSATISVYPNPAAEIINIQSNNSAIFTSAILVDITGKETILQSLDNKTLDVSSVPSGLYALYVKDDSGIVIHAQKVQIIR